MSRSIIALLTVVFCTVTSVQAYAQTAEKPRIAPLPASEWTDAHREALGRLGRGAQTAAVFQTCLRNLELCRVWMPFTDYLLSARNGLPPRERELLILVTGALCDAEYEWVHHAEAGRRVGLTETEIARTRQGSSAAGWSAFDAALVRAAEELHRNQRIADGTWAALSARYTEPQLMDVVFTVGQYTLVSMFLKSAGVQLEPGTSSGAR